jgi:uncharacterized protein (TIGR02099 family)
VNALLKLAVKKTVYVAAACIILVAMFFCVARLLSPVLDKHRADFEKWASQLLQNPVTIDTVRVSWYKYQPEINLNQVTVLSQQTKEPILHVEKVSIFFSIPRSIWQWQPVPSGIMITGTDVNLKEDANGQITIQGFPPFKGIGKQPYKSETKFMDVAAWLSQQPRLIMRDIDIRYTGFTGQKRFVTLYNLSFENAGAAHAIVGEAILHQKIPTKVTTTIQWHGDSVDFSKIKARIYLYMSGLQLGQWMKGYSWKGWQVNDGIVSSKIWAMWDHGTWQRIQTTFQSYGLNLYSATDKSTHKINRLSGNAGWKREGKNQIFAGDDLLIDLPSHLWPVTSFYLSLNPNANGVLAPKVAEIGYADLNDIQSFLFASPSLLPDSLRQLFSELKLKGSVQNAAITFSSPWTDWNHLSMNANFNGLGFSPWHQIPGASNLSGAIKWNGTKGSLTFQSKRTLFQYDSIFPNPIALDQLLGELKWQRDQHNGWMLQIPSLQILNNDAAANVSGSLTIPASGSPVINISANFTLLQVRHISRYLPMSTLDPDLAKWLQQAFLSGEVKSANAVIRGPLNDFPFDQGNGTFTVTGIINNMDLNYASDWPTLQHVNGKLTFAGRKMTVNIDSAQILDIPITHINGIIPNFGGTEPAILQLHSEPIQADFSQGLNFIHKSPLEKTLGKLFTGIDIQGPMTLKLGMTVPLKQPAKTKVLGDVELKNTEINLVPWHVKLKDLNGMLHFTEDTTEAKRIQGLLFNKPFQMNLATIQNIQKSKNVSVSMIEAGFTTNLSIKDLESWLKLSSSTSNLVQGAADVTGKIDFALKNLMEIHLRSDLVGITLNLPDQYGKKAAQARDFSADIIMQEQQPIRLKASYDKLLNVALILNRKRDQFNLVSANLHLGNGVATWPAGQGLYITGDFNQLDWDKIKMYINQSESGTNSFSSSFSSMLRGIDIRAGILNVVGQRLTQVRLQVTPSQKNWIINITSPEVIGQIQTPATITPQGQIIAEFQKLSLRSTPGSTKSIATIKVKSLPSLSFVANNVSYDNMPLGQVSFKAAPSSNGLNIRILNIISPRMELQARGDWSQSNVTRLQGSLTSSRVSELLDSLGFDVHNFISNKGKLTFDLSWDDAPYAPSLLSLTGNANLDMGPGRLVDVGQASGAKMEIGKMLSIFSLQTIPRRLTFDFSDIFQKGFSFDSIRGNFTLGNGSAYTKDLRFDGSVARVGINGRIGLTNKDYNLILSVTPYVSSSIPIAATLMGIQPLIGLAAMAVGTVINSSNAITYYYDVKGPWDNPTWGSVSVSKKR